MEKLVELGAGKFRLAVSVFPMCNHFSASNPHRNFDALNENFIGHTMHTV